MIRSLISVIRRLFGTSDISNKLDQLLIEARIASGFSRGAATAGLLQVNPKDPRTWEFGAFSQHGEDGVIEYLISGLLKSDRVFVEIAAGDGLENCTAWLALAKKWSGIMIEGDEQLANLCRLTYKNRIWNVNVISKYISLDNLPSILGSAPSKEFDIFSLDIDSIDFHILKAALDLSYRPKILVVEYNSVFGPDAAVCIPYRVGFNRWEAHDSGIYYGASISAWKTLLSHYGYRFVTVDTSGTNAFFVDSRHFQAAFLDPIEGIDFLENATDVNPTTFMKDTDGNVLKQLVPNWQRQFELISHLPLERVV
jgi:hypothetical protein